MTVRQQTEIAFWDTSAIVPLCCRQESTNAARRLAREHKKMVVWWGASVEAQSAFYRLLKERQITMKAMAHASQRIKAMKLFWIEVLPSHRVRDLAETLPQKYDLRAADSFQLAAALVWCDGKPRKRPFICFDVRLAEAARAAGFEVHPTI